MRILITILTIVFCAFLNTGKAAVTHSHTAFIYQDRSIVKVSAQQNGCKNFLKIEVKIKKRRTKGIEPHRPLLFLKTVDLITSFELEKTYCLPQLYLSTQYSCGSKRGPPVTAG